MVPGAWTAAVPADSAFRMRVAALGVHTAVCDAYGRVTILGGAGTTRLDPVRPAYAAHSVAFGATPGPTGALRLAVDDQGTDHVAVWDAAGGILEALVVEDAAEVGTDERGLFVVAARGGVAFLSQTTGSLLDRQAVGADLRSPVLRTVQLSDGPRRVLEVASRTFGETVALDPLQLGFLCHGSTPAGPPLTELAALPDRAPLLMLRGSEVWRTDAAVVSNESQVVRRELPAQLGVVPDRYRPPMEPYRTDAHLTLSADGAVAPVRSPAGVSAMPGPAAPDGPPGPVLEPEVLAYGAFRDGATLVLVEEKRVRPLDAAEAAQGRARNRLPDVALPGMISAAKEAFFGSGYRLLAEFSTQDVPGGMRVVRVSDGALVRAPRRCRRRTASGRCRPAGACWRCSRRRGAWSQARCTRSTSTLPPARSARNWPQWRFRREHATCWRTRAESGRRSWTPQAIACCCWNSGAAATRARRARRPPAACGRPRPSSARAGRARPAPVRPRFRPVSPAPRGRRTGR